MHRTGSVILALLTVASRLAAQEYDAATDFSLNDNPAGAWSYGWRASAASPFQTSTVVTPTLNPALFVWQGIPQNTFYGVPHVMFNVSTNLATIDSTTYRPRKITLVPGPAGELATVRWTAPAAGAISVQAKFSGRNSAVTSRAYVLRGNVTLLQAPVTGFESAGSVSYVTNLVVGPGETLDFGLDYGANLNWTFDTTEVEVRIAYEGTSGAPVIFLPPAGRFTNQVLVQLTSTVGGAEVRYTLDGSVPTAASPRYEGPLALTGRTLVRARAFLQGFAVGDAVSALYERVYAHAGDGIPDAWRQHYFGPDFALRPEAAPGADPDGDGLDNFREFLAGTNPLDPASGVVLGIRAVPELRWQGVSNLLYRVLRRDLAGPGAWQVIGTVQGTNGLATFLDLEARLPESYYALEVVR